MGVVPDQRSYEQRTAIRVRLKRLADLRESGVPARDGSPISQPHPLQGHAEPTENIVRRVWSLARWSSSFVHIQQVQWHYFSPELGRDRVGDHGGENGATP